jgi:hypothetical protein
MSETEDSEALSRGKRSPKFVVSAPTSTPTGCGKNSAVVGAPSALVAALPADTPAYFQTCPRSLRAFFIVPPRSTVPSAPGQAPASSPGGAGSSSISKPISASVARHQHVIKSCNGVPQGGDGQELAPSATCEGGARLGSSRVDSKTGGVRHELQVERQCALHVWNNLFAMEKDNQKDRRYFDDLQASLSREAHVSSPTQPANNVSHVLGAPLIAHLRYRPPLIPSSYNSLTHLSIHPPILSTQSCSSQSSLSSHSSHSFHSSHSPHLPSLLSLPTFSHWPSFCRLVGPAG